MKTLVWASVFLLAGCASSYEEATHAEPLGQGQYVISSEGNSFTSHSEMRHFLFRRAYETCSSDGLGYRILSDNDTTTGDWDEQDDGAGGYYEHQNVYPSAELVISCEGPVGPTPEAF